MDKQNRINVPRYPIEYYKVSESIDKTGIDEGYQECGVNRLENPEE